MRLLAFWILCAACAMAQEKPLPEVKPLPQEKPEVAQIARELEWVPGDYAAFEKLIERAKAAEIPESQLLLPQLDASLLFGDQAKLTEFLPKVEAAKADIIKQKGGTAEAKEEVELSLKLSKQYARLIKVRPKEAPRRAEMFRMILFAHQTIEDTRMLDAALDSLASDKKLAAGTEVTWEQLQGYVSKTSQLHTTGATIFGDKFGPFKIGRELTVPVESYQKLKDYLPAEAWEGVAPK
jgi:hypothetical protein